MNSCQKGKRNERAFRDVLRSFGLEARRGQQFSGSPDSPDVVCKDLPIHWEVKAVEALNIHKAMEQSRRDAGATEIPVVAHKKNGTGWLVTCDAQKFLEIVLKAYPNNKIEPTEGI